MAQYNIKELRLELKRLLNDLCGSARFEQLFSSATIWDWIKVHRKEIPDYISFNFGMTRFVFWDNRYCEVVFKVLINDCDIDYNANEEFIYNKACEYHVEKWFAWMVKVDSYEFGDNKIDFYAMEFCESDCDEITSEIESRHREENESNGVESTEESYDGSEEDMEYLMYSKYDQVSVDDLYNFLREFHVNDTHCGNWGYKDGDLILIDFGGYDRDLMALAEEAAK